METTLASLLVAVMLVAALNTVGAARRSQWQTALRYRGQLLAAELMAEILGHAYIDPGEDARFGCESGEEGSGRLSYDDVDDYNGWSCQPPTDPNGAPIADGDGWWRTASVVWVDPLDVNTVEAAESGAKRITVTVLHNDVPMASLAAVRTVAVPCR